MHQVKVFISSTFRDTQAERDHLVRVVLPKLREFCVRRDVELIGVDLRWGLTEADEALSACIHIIDECAPFFLCILGERYGWVPEGDEASITEREILHGALTGDKNERAFFYLRSTSATAKVNSPLVDDYRERRGSKARRKLKQLKRKISKAGYRLESYRPIWDRDSERMTGLDRFGELVYRDLSQAIETEFPQTQSSQSPVQLENWVTKNFISSRVSEFVLGDREKKFLDIMRYCRGESAENFLQLTGATGCGKSSFLAFCVNQLSADVRRVAIFAGVGDRSLRADEIIDRVLENVFKITGEVEPIPSDLDEREALLLRVLRSTAADKPLLLIFDGFDQLESVGTLAPLSWLSKPLPDNLRVILSTTPDEPYHIGKHTNLRVNYIDIEAVGNGDARKIIGKHFRRFNKALSRDQCNLLISTVSTHSPLWLKVIAEELRAFGEFDQFSEFVNAVPKGVLPALDWTYARWEGALSAELPDSLEFNIAANVIGTLAIMRRGIFESDLIGICATDEKLSQRLESSQIEQHAAILLRILDPYLSRETGRIRLSYSQMTSSAKSRYKQDLQALHARAGFWFSSVSASDSKTDSHVEMQRRALALREMLYHLSEAGEWDEAFNVMSIANLFEEIPAHEYGLSFHRGGFYGRTDEFLDKMCRAIPESGIDITQRLLRYLEIISSLARMKIKLASEFPIHWDQQSRIANPERFLKYRDLRYESLELCEECARVAKRILELDATSNLSVVRTYISENKDLLSYSSAMERDGSSITGLSGKFENFTIGTVIFDQLRRVN